MKSDFPDTISPILVKELRQGFTGILFWISFLAIQALLFFVLIIGISSKENLSQTALLGMYWGVLSLGLFLLLPIRAFSILRQEFDEGTMDVLFLTHMGPWRIVFGKWISIVAQGALVMFSVLPYFVVHYFSGKSNLHQILTSIILVWFIFIVLIAFIICISSYKSRILDYVVCFILLVLIPTILVTLIETSKIYFSGVLFGAILVIPPVLMLCLDIAASRISASDPWLTFRKRFLGLICIISMLLSLAFTDTTQHVIHVLSISFLFIIMLDSLSLPNHEIHSPYKNFPITRKVLNLLFLPNQWSALLMTLVLLTFFTFVCLFTMYAKNDYNGVYLLPYYSLSILFPLLLNLLIRFVKINFVVTLIIFYAVSFALLAFLDVANMEWLLCWNPVYITQGSDVKDVECFVALLVLMLTIPALLFLVRPSRSFVK